MAESINMTLRFGKLQIQRIEAIGREGFWRGHAHDLNRDQYEAVLDTFPVLTKDKMIEGEAGTFRAADVDFGGLRLTIYTSEVSEQDVEAFAEHGFIPILD